MLHVFCIFLFCFFGLLKPDFSRDDFSEDADGMPGEFSARKIICVADDIYLPAEIPVTSKGNGMLSISNLSLGVYDVHDDGAYFQDELLGIYFVDLDGDSNKDLLIFGWNIHTSEKGDDILYRDPIVFCAFFQPQTRTYRIVFSRSGTTEIIFEKPVD